MHSVLFSYASFLSSWPRASPIPDADARVQIRIGCWMHLANVELAVSVKLHGNQRP